MPPGSRGPEPQKGATRAAATRSTQAKSTSAKAKVRRKKKRAPWPWKGILTTLLVGNLVAGVLWSPALSIRRAVIEGAAAGKAPLAEKALATLRGDPALRADAMAIESLALSDSRYETADFRRSLLGSARLKLKRRQPVAAVVVVNEAPLMMDASGTVYDAPDEDWKTLPRVILTDNLRMTAATLGAPCNLRTLADIAIGIRPIAGGTPVGIEVRPGGVICLNMESARVRLGTGDRLEAKLSMLQRILAGKPGILREIKELNLMAPDRPKTIPRTGNPSPSVSLNSRSGPSSARTPR